MDLPSDVFMMLLGDARLPVAGHTQSAGLEPAVQGGLTADEVPLYLAARLETVVRVEAGTAVVALHHLDHGLGLDEVVTAWAARTPSPALRRSSRAQGRALARLARRLWPDSPAVARLDAVPGAPRALVLAATASAVRLRPGALARLVGYDDVQTVAAAALKLLPLDPAVVTGWVHDALPAVAALATDVASLTAAEDIPASAAPQIDLWAQSHAHTTRRLFSA